MLNLGDLIIHLIILLYYAYIKLHLQNYDVIV
jgi:hypothetical protein